MTHVQRSGPWWATLFGTVGWGLAIGVGFLALQIYEFTPGHAGSGIAQWPGRSRVPLAGQRPTLVMAAHPRCPCTRASVAELARLLARCEGRVAVYVLIFTPRHADPTWGRSGCSPLFASLPGVHLIDDPGGDESSRF